MTGERDIEAHLKPESKGGRLQDGSVGAAQTGRPDRSGRAPGTGRDEPSGSDGPVAAPAHPPRIAPPLPPGLTVERFLLPSPMACMTCGAKGVVYPSIKDQPRNGRLCCPNCTPDWFADFLLFRLDAERAEHGLPPIEEIELPTGLAWEEYARA